MDITRWDHPLSHRFYENPNQATVGHGVKTTSSQGPKCFLLVSYRFHRQEIRDACVLLCNEIIL